MPWPNGYAIHIEVYTAIPATFKAQKSPAGVAGLDMLFC